MQNRLFTVDQKKLFAELNGKTELEKVSLSDM